MVRSGTPEDLPATGALTAQREGGDAEEWVAQHRRRFDDDRQKLLVVEFEGRIVGYGWLSWLTPVADGGRNAPDGWYLSGMVVDPDHRRQGIGSALTRARVAWALEQGEQVHYVVSASNRVSRDLHASFGFREVTSDFQMPGVVFSRDDGILCTLTPQPDAEVVDLASRRRAH